MEQRNGKKICKKAKILSNKHQETWVVMLRNFNESKKQNKKITKYIFLGHSKTTADMSSHPGFLFLLLL